MRQVKILPRTTLFLGAIALVAATLATGQRASAQYVCPAGYYYLAGYGCVPLDYSYGPPDYIYPDYGFGFFYGGGWGRGYRGGGGYHGGGGFHGGGGGHGGGHR